MQGLPLEGISFIRLLHPDRKTYGSWIIPAAERRAYAINDGDEIIVSFAIGETNFEIFRTVTSGGEFLLYKPLAQKLRTSASIQGEIRFTIFDPNGVGEQKKLDGRLAEKVAQSLDDDATKRRARLAKAPRKPERIKVTIWSFVRNPDVIAEALLLAAGFCQQCRKGAPFTRKRDGSPYLEVHHILPLAEGGEDTVDNAVALCPNCHRQAHHGWKKP